MTRAPGSDGLEAGDRGQGTHGRRPALVATYHPVMAIHTCWFCGAPTSHVQASSIFDLDGVADDQSSFTFAVQCVECSRLATVSMTLGGDPGGDKDQAIAAWKALPREHHRLLSLEWAPVHDGRRDYGATPERIAETANEAHSTFSVKAYKAAMMLARAVTEAVTKDKGCQDKYLREKIDALAEKGYISKLMAKAAHEIRHFGNASAHADFVNEDPVTQHEAEEILQFMDDLLEDVYERDVRRGVMAQARADRKAAVQSRRSDA